MMSLLYRRLTIVLLACVALLTVSTNQASAAFSTLHLGPNTDPLLLLAQGSSESPIAEARYGDSGGRATWEVGAGQHTQQSGNFANTNNTWVNGATVGFTLDYDGNDLAFSVGTSSVTYTMPFGEPDLMIVAKSKTGSSASITNLVLNGSAVGIDLLSDTPTNGSDHLIIFNAFDNGTFSLTGDLAFAWDANNIKGTAKGSRLEMIVKSADFEQPPVIPEPATIGLAMAGVALMIRRRH